MRLALALPRSLLFLLLQSLLTVLFAVIALLTFPFAPLTRYRVISTWSRLVIQLARRICGIRYRVIGRENLPAQAAIVLSKH